MESVRSMLSCFWNDYKWIIIGYGICNFVGFNVFWIVKYVIWM